MKHPDEITLGEIKTLFRVHGVGDSIALKTVESLLISCQLLEKQYVINKDIEAIRKRNAPPKEPKPAATLFVMPD